MHVQRRLNSRHQFSRHPRRTVIQYAVGGRVKNLAKLRKHLTECPECSDRARFIQTFINVLRGAGIEERGREAECKRSPHL